MKLKHLILRHAGTLALASGGLVGLLAMTSGLVHYNSQPSPAPQARLGSVTIDLQQLDHRLVFEDLQAAGMFRELECRKCDFSRSRTRLHLSENDFSDIDFLGTLYLGRGREVLWLHFYGRDIPAGQQRLERSLQNLRARFPGREHAIKQVAGVWEDGPTTEAATAPSATGVAAGATL